MATDLNRRQFFTGAVATAAALSVPGPVAPAQEAVMVTTKNPGVWVERIGLRFEREMLTDGRFRLKMFEQFRSGEYKFVEYCTVDGRSIFVQSDRRNPDNPNEPIALWPWIESMQSEMYGMK